MLKSIVVASALAMAAAAPASALVLTADYSDASVSSGIYITAGGQLQSGAGGGATDVTATFKANVNAAFTYLQNSIGAVWNEVVTFKLFDFAAAMINADGDSSIDSIHISDNRPATSTIRLDSSSVSSFFVDPTPFDNSEYNMVFADAGLGGGSVNVRRAGEAVASGPAENRTDVLTLLLHELVHSTGFNFLDRFDTAAGGAVGDPNRKITIPTSLSGLTTDFDLPFLSASDHVDPVAAGGVFKYAITSEPSFGANERWLPTGAELYALCVVEGCTANQVNPNLIGAPANTVPEPSTMLLIAAAGLGLLGTRRRRMAA